MKKDSSKKSTAKKSVAKKTAVKKTLKRVKSPIQRNELSARHTVKQGDVKKERGTSEKRAIRSEMIELMDEVLANGGILIAASNKTNKAASYFKDIHTSDVYKLVFNAVRDRKECINQVGDNAKRLFEKAIDQVVKEEPCPVHSNSDDDIDEIVKMLSGKGNGVKIGVIRATSMADAMKQLKQVFSKYQKSKKGKK